MVNYLMPLPEKGGLESQTFSNGFRPLPFTSGSSAVPTLLTGSLTACQFPGPAWLNYDTAFRKDAAASLLADWSKMNLDLYNFHTRASSTVTSQSAPHSTSLPHTSCSLNIPPKRSFDPIQYCRSWNDGACRWSLGRCRYRHVCERCNGQHPLTNCPFEPTTGFSAPGPSLHSGENAVGVNYKVSLQVAGINFGSFWEAA